jgi:hypothetical protein
MSNNLEWIWSDEHQQYYYVTQDQYGTPHCLILDKPPICIEALTQVSGRHQYNWQNQPVYHSRADSGNEEGHAVEPGAH